jgi:tRNA A-37 threonylcarbamoyl transferase component Bud32
MKTSRMAPEDVPERLGPYRLLRRLGEGGMGVVYLAADAAGRLVAVKALRPSVTGEADARHRLAHEVAIMRRVRSPLVAEIVDADLDADVPYIVTQYVAGRTLEDVVRSSGPLAGGDLARLAVGLAGALAAIHTVGVVHRDLKPGNVMLTSGLAAEPGDGHAAGGTAGAGCLFGDPVIIDFGIAQAPDSTRLTQAGMFMGTPGYLAPEVVQGHPSSPASDVHSWGATVAFAATGRPPYGGGPFESIFYRIVHGQPDLAGLPHALSGLVLAALARDPAQRPRATDLVTRAAALDPAALVASRPASGLTTVAPATILDPARPAAAGEGYPLAGDDAARLPAGYYDGDLADVLPPVRYGEPAVKAGGEPARPKSAVSARGPVVLAVVALAVALSVLLPVVAAPVCVAGLAALYAADLTGQRLSRRRSARGARPGDALVAAASFPFALARSLLRLLMLAPLALLGAGFVAAVTIIGVRYHPFPRALGYGIGAAVAFYALGPGSAATRRPLARSLNVAARTPALKVVVFIGVGALALAAIVTAASAGPVYWPVSLGHIGARLGPHFALRSLVHQLRNHLAGLIARSGG